MIKGSYVALVTPFKNNEVDYSALEKLIEFHIAGKTDGILLCGTTGESPALAGDEKAQLVRFCINRVNKRIPVMVGTGTNNINKTIAATNTAKQWGADSALVITPYYNKPTQNGMYHFFKTVHEATNIPLVIYNVPGRTGVKILTETVLKLAHECKRIIAIKEASGDLIQASEIVRDAPKNFSVLSGEDALNYPIMACGGKGLISVTANILPEKLKMLSDAMLNLDYKTALKIHQELLDINDAMFLETNPIPVKKALALMRMIADELRLPLYKMDTNLVEKLKIIMRKHLLI